MQLRSGLRETPAGPTGLPDSNNVANADEGGLAPQACNRHRTIRHETAHIPDVSTTYATFLEDFGRSWATWHQMKGPQPARREPRGLTAFKLKEWFANGAGGQVFRPAGDAPARPIPTTKKFQVARRNFAVRRETARPPHHRANIVGTLPGAGELYFGGEFAFSNGSKGGSLC